MSLLPVSDAAKHITIAIKMARKIATLFGFCNKDIFLLTEPESCARIFDLVVLRDEIEHPCDFISHL